MNSPIESISTLIFDMCREGEEHINYKRFVTFTTEVLGEDNGYNIDDYMNKVLCLTLNL